jgi:DUF4097 and DUF4098 domain-containing protein YvlB
LFAAASLFLALLAFLAVAGPAGAQRLPFERAIDVTPGATLDVSTFRGKVDITADDVPQVRVQGTVTVRLGFDVPANALELAQRVADRPRIEVAGNVVRLRPPVDSDELRAVTVSYVVRVPRDTRVIITTDSGAITLDDVAGSVAVTTQSSSIALSRLGGKTEVKTGSGEVKVDRAEGGLSIVTQSSAITARGLRGAFDARTQSGAVRATFVGPGGADVETGSSGIQIDGLAGPLTVRTQSGRVEVRGAPAGTGGWNIVTGSSSVEIALDAAARMTLDATTHSSNIRLDDVTVDGTVMKGRVSGTVGGGGPTVRIATRNGSIRISG